MRWCVLLVGWSLLGSSVAADNPRDDEARVLFESGNTAFADGEYDDALDAFSRSYDLSGRPELLYNIGQCHDRLRNDSEALEAFEAFMQALPRHEQAPSVRTRIEVIRGRLAEQRELAEAAGPGAAPWIIAALGGAVAAAGGVMLGLAARDRNAVEDAEPSEPWSELEDAHDRVVPFSISGSVMLGVGGAALATGVVWGILGADGADVAIGPGGVQVRGTF